MSSIWLNGLRANVTSQNGEDGVIQAILDKVGSTSRWCCEFGAWDGVHFSNTHNLLLQGWSGVLIEADAGKFLALKANMAKFPDVVPVHAFVRDLDAILEKTVIPREFDILSIDIDGRDYHVWKAMERYRPRIVVIEVNSDLPPDLEETPGPRGASIKSMVSLGKHKGYELALHTGNAIFVSRELAPALGINAENWEALFDRSWLVGTYGANQSRRSKGLVAMVTCEAHFEQARACRETWVPLIKQAGFEMEFFDGKRLGVPDDYPSLPLKTKALCQWAVGHGYENLMKCDDDTYVNARKFAVVTEDYGGSPVPPNDFGDSSKDSKLPPRTPESTKFTYANGGCYWLSRKSMLVVAEAAIDDWAEDRWIGQVLGGAGITLKTLPGYWAWNDPRTPKEIPRQDRGWTTLTQIPNDWELRKLHEIMK